MSFSPAQPHPGSPQVMRTNEQESPKPALSSPYSPSHPLALLPPEHSHILFPNGHRQTCEGVPSTFLKAIPLGTVKWLWGCPVPSLSLQSHTGIWPQITLGEVESPHSINSPCSKAVPQGWFAGFNLNQKRGRKGRREKTHFPHCGTGAAAGIGHSLLFSPCGWR